MSQRRGSTVGEIESLWSILNRPVGESECMTTFVRVVVIFRAKVSCITSMVKSSTGKSGWSSKTRCYWSPVGYAVVLLAMRSPNVMVSFRSVFCHNYNGRFFVGRIVGCILSSHSIVVSFCVKLNLITPLVQN